MTRTALTTARKLLKAGVRAWLGWLPARWRHALYRAMVDCDASPDPRLQVKIAETQDELEACFRILHDAYVAAGFMRPDPSGLRVTIYHALPSTTTLCAKWGDQVVGTLSMVRDGVFGFPMQRAFDLTALRAAGGTIAEVSALAIDPRFRKTGGQVLFPLMKMMYQYCREYFDTRHLVIAVNPNRIDLYESLLGFRRLGGSGVSHYDFANGAPAVGATLDLATAADWFDAVYGKKHPRKNLHRYFVKTLVTGIQLPQRIFHTTNDPVLTPAMMDYFFNQRTAVFGALDDRQRLLLRSIYDLDAYAAVLPQAGVSVRLQGSVRQHQRFSLRCPARLRVRSYGEELAFDMQVVEVSLNGLLAECSAALPEGTRGRMDISLGTDERAVLHAHAVRRLHSEGRIFYGFALDHADEAWARCVQALSNGRTLADLAVATAPAAGLAPTVATQGTVARPPEPVCLP